MKVQISEPHPFASGGSKNRGPHSGAYSTFWNLRASSPPPNFDPLLNIVGVGGDIPPNPEYHWTVEPISPAKLCPANLYEEMYHRRLSSHLR